MKRIRIDLFTLWASALCVPLGSTAWAQTAAEQPSSTPATEPASAPSVDKASSAPAPRPMPKPVPSAAPKPMPKPVPSAAPTASSSAPLVASTPPPADDTEEIFITTARKRKESLYESPAAISTLGAEGIDSLNVTNVDDLGKYIPNLTITRFGVGNTSQAAVFIRGIGVQDHLITTDPGVGVYLDGVYLGRQMGNNLSLTNIERIEVLRGPQGTLYGRNTLGGAVNIITRKPGDEDIVQVQLQAGTRKRLAANFYGNFRLADTLSMSAIGGFTRRDGIGDAINLTNPEAEIGEINEFSGRVALKWEPTSTFRLLATVDGMHAENGQSPSTIELIGPPDDSVEPLQPSDIPPRDDTATNVEGLESTSNEVLGFSLTAELDISSNWTAKLLSSYRHSQYTGGLDDDVTARNLSEFPEFGEADQYSAELQVNGRFEDFEMVAGLYYFREEGRNDSGLFTFFPFSTATENDFFELEQTTNSLAGYANGSYLLFDALRVGAGIRYTRDAKLGIALFPSFAGTPKPNQKVFSAITYDFNASYLFARNMSVYAQVQRGYQTGGFPPRPFGGPDQFNIFDEITALNYEVGFKGIINEHIRVLTSFYWTEYSDLAVPFSMPSGTGFVTIVENAAGSRARGFEVEANFMYAGFFLNPSVGFIDAEFTDVEEGVNGIQVGAAPPLTPQWTLGANGGYLHNFENVGSLRVQINYSFRDEQFGQAVESDSELLDARSLLGFNVEFTNQDGDWDLELYGRNILNEVYDQGRLNNPFHGFVGVVLSNDRSEFGLRFTKRFGI